MSRSDVMRIALTVHVTRTNVYGRRYGDPNLLEPGGTLEVVEQTPWISFAYDPAIARVVGFTLRRDDRFDVSEGSLRLLDEITFDVPEHGLFDAGVGEILKSVLADGASSEWPSRAARLPSEVTDETDRETAFKALTRGAFSAVEHGHVGRWLVEHGELGSGLVHLRAAHAMSPADPLIAEAFANACLQVGDEDAARSALESSRMPHEDPWRVSEWSLRGGTD